VPASASKVLSTRALCVGLVLLSTSVLSLKSLTVTAEPKKVESNFKKVTFWKKVWPPVTTEPFLNT
jgi:hypothetical protein